MVWCSPELGLFRTAAKGALRPQSPFAGRLDLYVTCEVAFVRARKAGSDLHTLSEVHLQEARLGVRGSYLRILAAAYFGKLLEMVAENETPLGTLHELLVKSLDYLETHDPTLRLLERFETRLCHELGLGEQTSSPSALLQEVFHRALPTQRKELLHELERQHTGKPSTDANS